MNAILARATLSVIVSGICGFFIGMWLPMPLAFFTSLAVGAAIPFVSFKGFDK